jgi:hypothetical protein
LREAVTADPDLLLLPSIPDELTRSVIDHQTGVRRERLVVLNQILLRMAQAEAIHEDLQALANEARELDTSWSEIGRAAGVTPQSAHRRWDPDARRKHAEYQRTQRIRPAELADPVEPEDQ